MNAISLHHLTKTYSNGVKALRNVHLEIPVGDFFSLLGANGAGKTTLIGILTSLVTKTYGQVKVFDYDLDHELNKAKFLIGVVPQEFNFNIFEKIIDVLVTQAGYFGIKRAKAHLQAELLLHDLHLWPQRDMPVRMLSGGMKRRLMIARALVHKPKLLILDEPTAGVDIELRQKTWDYLRQLNAAGTTILLTTHYLEEAEQLCRNVAIIKEGSIIKHGNTRQLLSSLEKQTYVVTVNKLPGTRENPGFDMTIVDQSTLEVDFGLHQNLGDFVHMLRENGIEIHSMRPKGNRLEQLFLKLTR